MYKGAKTQKAGGSGSSREDYIVIFGESFFLRSIEQKGKYSTKVTFPLDLRELVCRTEDASVYPCNQHICPGGHCRLGRGVFRKPVGDGG